MNILTKEFKSTRDGVNFVMTIVLSVALLIVFGIQIKDGIKSLSFVEVEGTVVDQYSQDNGVRVQHYYEIEYEYNANTYITVQSVRYSDSSSIGKKVHVKIDPDHPNMVKSKLGGGAVCIDILLLIGLGYFLFSKDRSGDNA